MSATDPERGSATGLDACRELARRALPVWGLEGADLELIKARENVVFRVDEAGGDRFVMRIHRAGYHTDAELRSEILWSRALDEVGVLTPRVLPARNGEPFVKVALPGSCTTRQVDLVEWIEGVPLGEVESAGESSSDTLVSAYRTIGELAGRLHQRGRCWTPPRSFVRHAWDVEGIVGDAPLWGRFWEHALLEPDQRTVVLRARKKLRRDLDAFGQAGDRYGLIHADLLPENILVTPAGIRLIDFDDCGYGWDLFEIATSLFLHVGAPHYEALLGALVAGYRSERALPDAHLERLPAFFAARATTYLGWIHTRSESETAEKLGPVIVAGVAELLASYGTDP